MQRVYEYSEPTIQIEFEGILNQNINSLSAQGFVIYSKLKIY